MKQALFSIFLLNLFLHSCARVQEESKELTQKVRKKVGEESAELKDKVLPQFDAETPDTKWNKIRFDDFIKVERTSDVKNIYCFDDAIGIDADYQFSFNCSEQTAQKICEKHQLKRNKLTTDFAFGLQDDFDWWNKQKIAQLPLFSWTDNNQYYKYFWYDKKEQKAYFFDFDM